MEGLRPPALDELGLGPAVTQAVSSLATPAGIRTDIAIPESLPDVPAAVEVAIYRIIAEAVTNVVRHAGAKSCRVAIGLRDHVVVADVCDDGGGFLVAEAGRPAVSGRPCGHGLTSMRERAEELGGSLQIRTDGGGTRVTATLPLPETSP